MGGISLLARAEIRHRWASLLGLAAIVSLVAFVLCSGLAGARRTGSVLDRFMNRTRTSDVIVGALSPELASDPAVGEGLARALAEVEGVTAAGVAVGFPLDIAGDYFMIYSSPDNSTFNTEDLPVVVAGRLPVGPDEVAVNREAQRRLSLEIGDLVSGPTLRNEDMGAVFGDQGFPGFLGEVVEVRVVGVIERGEDLSSDGAASGPAAIAAPEFAEAYAASVGSYLTEVRLSTTETSEGVVDRITQAAALEVGGFEVSVRTTDEVWADNARDAFRVLALTIVGFTLVAAAAGILVVTQAIEREVSLAGRSDTVLRAVGMQGRARLAVAAGPAWVAILLGLVVGVAGAVVVSSQFPIGRARHAEVVAGPYANLRTIQDVVVLAAALIGWSLVAARRVTRERSWSRSPRSGRIGRWVAHLGVRPSTVMGVRMAIEPGAGATSTPVRSAITGSVVAIAAVTSLAVVSSTAADVVADPSRYGWVWSTIPDNLSEDPDAVERAASIDGVDAVAGLWFTTVSLDGTQVPAAAFEAVAGSMAFTQFEGRQPTGPSEVALAAPVAADLGVEIGDRLTFDPGGPHGGAGAQVDVVVVGTVVGPPIDNVARDVVFSVDGLFALAQSEPTAYLAIRYKAGASASQVERDLEAIGYRFTSSAYPEAPSRVEQFRTVTPLLHLLALVIALLGALGLLHFLATTVRRRRGDLAVVRALGFLRRDVHRSIAWQAVTSVGIGLVAGIPLGAAAGRTAWLLAVEPLGIVDDPTTPWWLLAGIIAAAVVGAIVVSIGPGRIAARRPAVGALRVE